MHSPGTKQASAVFPDSKQGLSYTKEKGDLVLQRPSEMQWLSLQQAATQLLFLPCLL